MDNSRKGVVVIGGDHQGLGVLRSLGRNGVRTFLVDSELGIGRFSRFRGGFAKCPPPGQDDGAALVGFLLSIAETRELTGWVLFPNSDEVVRALAQGKSKLESTYVVPVPDWETARVFAEKRATYELASRLGIPCPKTCYPTETDELETLGLSFPVIVKPLCRDPFYALTRKKAVRAGDIQELRQVWEWASAVVPPSELMVQEVVPGGASALFSLGCLFYDRRLQGCVVAHRTRQHPMDFGHATTFAETVDIPELEVMGATILREAGYEGLAEVEFMLDSRDGTYRLLEVNPRVWGWHTLAGAAGVDLPYLFYQSVVGSDHTDHSGFAAGVKWLRPITDVPTALIEIAHGRLRIREYFSSIAGPKELAPAPSWDDPAPFAMEFLLIPYLWAKRGL